MGDRLVYEAGASPAGLPHALRMRWLTADPVRRAGAARLCEFWCQRHSGGPWRVEHTERHVSVSFARHPDLVLFFLGDCCDGVTDHGIAQRADPERA